VLQRVDGMYLFFLLAEQILLVPPHLFVLDLHDLLVCFFSLEVHAGLLTLLAVILEQLEELDHVGVEGVSG